MKNYTVYFVRLLLAVAAAGAWAGCRNVETELLQDISETRRTQPEDSLWTLSIQAVKEEPGTKGLAIGDGDTEASTTILRSIWKAEEPVEVYQEGTCIGTLKATPDATDAHYAILSGTVTATGITPGTTKLTLLTPRQKWDYTGQVGRLLLQDDANNQGDQNRSIEKRYHYTLAENVLVTGVSVDQEGKASLTTGNAGFTNQQSIYRLSFRYQHNGAGDKFPITAKRTWITAADGGLVLSRGLDGSSVTGTIDIILDAATADPFFVALRNNNTTTAEELKFKVMDNEGITYYGTKTVPAAYKPNGTFVSIKNATLTDRLGVTLHAGKTVNTVL